MGLGSRGVWEEGSQLIGATDPRTPRIGDTGSTRFNSEVQAIPTSDEQKQAPWGRRGEEEEMPKLGVTKHRGTESACQDRQEAFPQWTR